jgi:5'-phosphate synthase pdxT subunit
LLVGVLALQGDFREHESLIRSLGHEARKVRRPSELSGISALIIPGGESTAISNLAQTFGMLEPIKASISAGLPVLGTCAGLIMLADEVEGAIAGQRFIGGLPVKVSRNAYGGQTHSFEASIEIAGESERVAFIRAPRILNNNGAEVIASLNGEPVAVRKNNIWGATFHPEITGAKVLHTLFLDQIQQ